VIEYKCFEDITQIRMSRELDGKPLYWVAAYLVDGLLVDTGCHYTAQELTASLEGRPPRMVVNTHFHEDHIGGNALLQERYGVDVFAPKESVPLIARKAVLFPYQEMVWGYPVPTQVRPIPEVVETDHYTFVVVNTPGHSLGHVVLLEKDRGWCFSGDIFARDQPKFIRPEEDMGETVASMKKILAMTGPHLILFTATGRIIEDGRQALEDCVFYLENLAAKAKSLEAAGLTVQAIMQDLFGGEHAFAQFTDGQFTTENLVRSVLGMPNSGSKSKMISRR
jgi:hydroxyacylglutathione hydrolase